MSRALFIGGTASHVGKSWFTTAFCRLLYRRGVRVSPFKAQNMSNNSFPCIEGGEIGRAQVVQAEACNLPPMADMNPVLLKPNSLIGSQVVVQGKVWRTVPAAEYYRHTAMLFDKAFESFARLSRQFDAVVCEGAGSVAEVNLFDRDITNLRFAARVGAKALLVADIERGGVFASLVGSMELLPPEQRATVRAFAVNRFRGDPALFEEGVRFLEQRLGLPCLGVFPYADDIAIDDEDSVSLPSAGAATGGRVAAIRFPRISNFTDLRLLRPSWIDRPVDHPFDIVILPGTKNTIADLNWLRAQGLEPWIRRQHDAGAMLVGICGGYQMLGERIEDPHGVESTLQEARGLGLLPAHTVLAETKVTQVVRLQNGHPAYEIHMGRTECPAPPLFTLDNRCPEGARHGRVMGTYLHGAFESAAVVRDVLGIEVPEPTPKPRMYDRLADWLTMHSNPNVLEALLP
ncbi:MAG: cobyric acid synthase [Bryobacterales bacterium]|nr:cobyric acid synthase [Bryobacterales bacterium]